MAQAEKPKLLIVDDEPDQVESIQKYFSRRNFLIFTSESGEQALSLIKKHKPEIVLLDMKLSGDMTGKDVLRVLRQTDKGTKVVMVTGDILSDEEMENIAKLGVVKFLIKPVKFETLEEIVKTALKESHPNAVRFEAIKVKEEASDASLRRIAHDLSNVTSDIANKCELYILDTEEGLNSEKSEKDRLNEALSVLRSVLKSTEKLTDLVKKVSELARKDAK